MSRTLSVEAMPADDVVEPGGSTTVTVEVTDADGDAVEDAELLVVAVDEAVLALTGYELLDPLEIFYRSLGGSGGVYRGRQSILLADPQALLDLVRELDNAVSTTTSPSAADSATAAPDDMSDGDGFDHAVGGRRRGRRQPGDRGSVELRCLGLVGPGGGHRRPGTSHDRLRPARQPHPLPGDGRGRRRGRPVRLGRVEPHRPAAAQGPARRPPRFLNFGDDFELPVVVQNQTDEAMDVDVVLQTANLAMTGPSGPAGVGPGERPCRGPLPGRHRVGRDGALPGRRGERRPRRRSDGGPARLHPGHGRGLRHLRRRRPRRHDPAVARSRGSDPAVRWSRGHDFVDGRAGPDRCGPLPRRVPVHERRRLRLADPGDRGAARCARSVRGRGHPDAGRVRPHRG